MYFVLFCASSLQLAEVSWVVTSNATQFKNKIYLYLHRQMEYTLHTCSVPSHYLNQWWLIVNWTLTNIVQWNLHRNLKKKSSTKLHLKMSSAKVVVALMSPHCVKTSADISRHFYLYIAGHIISADCSQHSRATDTGGLGQWVPLKIKLNKTSYVTQCYKNGHA